MSGGIKVSGRAPGCTIKRTAIFLNYLVKAYMALGSRRLLVRAKEEEDFAAENYAVSEWFVSQVWTKKKIKP